MHRPNGIKSTEFGVSSGRIIPHNEGLAVIDGPSFLYQISGFRQKEDSLAWRRAANFPSVGLTLLWPIGPQ